MEINLNCDLGEKSKHHSNENDPDLLKLVTLQMWLVGTTLEMRKL